MDLAQISQVDNALLQACLEGNEDALAHAVRHGALATRARDAMGATPLHMACLGGHLDIALLHGLSNHLREKSILSNAELRLLDGEIVGFDVKADESDQVFESKMRVWQLHVSWSLFN